jgi:hypothetical protein
LVVACGLAVLQDDAVEKQKKALKKVDDDGDIECKLDDRLQYLVKLICNLSMMKETLVEMEFDINKMPLGAPFVLLLRSSFFSLFF